MVLLYFALTEGGTWIPPTYGVKAFCPCRAEVIAKIGSGERAAHWAHKVKSECDPWLEKGKSVWHEKWQALLRNTPDDQHKEVWLTDGKVWHIADAIGNNGVVIEFQHSYITEEDVREREQFYTKAAGEMIWVVDMTARKQIPGWVDITECPVYLHYPSTIYLNGGEDVYWSTLYHRFFSEVVEGCEDYYEFAAYINNTSIDKFMEAFWYPHIPVIPIYDKEKVVHKNGKDIVEYCFKCYYRGFRRFNTMLEEYEAKIRPITGYGNIIGLTGQCGRCEYFRYNGNQQLCDLHAAQLKNSLANSWCRKAKTLEPLK